eukprot:Awhi_evm3s14632
MEQNEDVPGCHCKEGFQVAYEDDYDLVCEPIVDQCTLVEIYHTESTCGHEFDLVNVTNLCQDSAAFYPSLQETGLNECQAWKFGTYEQVRVWCEQNTDVCAGFNFVREGIHSFGYGEEKDTVLYGAEYGTAYYTKSLDDVAGKEGVDCYQVNDCGGGKIFLDGYCGDGLVNGPNRYASGRLFEECDDNNTDAGDGCDESCLFEGLACIKVGDSLEAHKKYDNSLLIGQVVTLLSIDVASSEYEGKYVIEFEFDGNMFTKELNEYAFFDKFELYRSQITRKECLGEDGEEPGVPGAEEEEEEEFEN